MSTPTDHPQPSAPEGPDHAAEPEHGGHTDLLAGLDRVVDEVLWPAALTVDGLDAIPDAHYEALADLGLFGLAVPRARGGLGLDGPTTRRVLRTLGRGCGATAFAFAQHHGAAAAVAHSANPVPAAVWLDRLLTGTLAGTAFAHVRRAGSAAVRATPSGGGWRLDGEAPWATSWGRAEVFTVAATGPDDEIVWVLVPGTDGDGMSPSGSLALMVFDATATVRLRFEGLDVGPDDVLSVEEAGPWRRSDRLGAARPNPLCLGVGDRALALLADVDPALAAAHRRAWVDAADQAEAACALADARRSALARGAEPGSDDDVLHHLATCRARSILEVQRLTTALLAAVGGRGAELTHGAQLLARQALFYVIQAQNADGRAATLAALTPGTEGERGR